jgi:hypothetical protein
MPAEPCGSALFNGLGVEFFFFLLAAAPPNDIRSEQENRVFLCQCCQFLRFLAVFFPYHIFLRESVGFILKC